MLTEASEGSIVIPVINAIRHEDKAIIADVESFAARMRHAAPTSVIAQPVMIDDFEVEGRTEDVVGSEAAQEVADSIQAMLGS
jgi:hypothetical protein